MRRLALFLLVASGLAACDAGPGGSLYDPGAADGPTPVITSVSPSGIVLAGVDEIVISGQNFSATPADNLVFFDDGAGAVAQGTVLAASSTELRVKVPNLPNPALRLRVAVRGAEQFSNEIAFPLTPAFTLFGNLDPGLLEEVFALTPDGSGGILASLFSNGSSAGIVRIASDGTRTPYVASSATWSGLTLGADGTRLYGTRRLRAAFELPEGGSQQTLAVFSSGASLAKIAVAPSGDLYAAGTHTDPAAARIYRITPSGDAAETPFADPVTALAIHDGALYVGTATASSSRVLRLPIGASGDLGAPELVYDVTAAYGTAVAVSALAVAADGTVYVGTNARDPIIEVATDGTAAPLYPGVLSPPVSGFAWGPGSQLYVAIASVGSSVEGGARTPGTLYRLETRRQGPL